MVPVPVGITGEGDVIIEKFAVVADISISLGFWLKCLTGTEFLILDANINILYIVKLIIHNGK